MRILAIGDECDLGAMYDRLHAEGHELRVYVEREDLRGILRAGPRPSADWKADLPWVREAGSDGLILFECATRGEDQDELRRQGFSVFGGSAYGDRLESDRDFGQNELRAVGLQTAATHHFRDYAAGIDFVRERPGRYVFKKNGDGLRTDNYVGQDDDGGDVVEVLQGQIKGAGEADFVLMQHVCGVEVGIGAYFNGERFLKTICIDWEHKRFFPGDLGELTGEMGTIVSYRGADAIFEATLARMEQKLRAGGYCGYINLNLIANEQGLWPLEFTSRFGYPGYAICGVLHRVGWVDIFRRMLDRSADSFPTEDGFAAGVVLTVPPFPYTFGYEQISKGVRIRFNRATDADLDNLHLCEVESRADGLVAGGVSGRLAVATGKGPTIATARMNALAVAGKVVVPNLRYRQDIGERQINGELERLRGWGYLG